MLKRSGDISRRNLLKGASVAAVGCVTGFPYIARAQANTIRIGIPTILSGRVAILGTSSLAAAELVVKRFNEQGGIGGKRIELVARDTKASPDEAARVARDMINSDDCEIIVDAEASTGSFAIQEVIRDTSVLCLHTNSETSSLTADPSIRSETAFRTARQGIHDAVAGGLYASRISKEQNKKRWMSCSPDYAYGRDNTAQFLEYLQHYDSEVEVVNQVWPSLFEPDYNNYVTRIMQERPDAFYSALWGGDLVAFIEQAGTYGLFNNISFFSGSLADPPVIHGVSQLPEGLHSIYRYDPQYPDNEANRKFAEKYETTEGELPTNWSWQTALAFEFIFEALRRTEGSTDSKRLAGEIAGMEIKTGFSNMGKVTMREEDHTVINYPVAWGQSASDPRGMVDWVPGDWSEIIAQEKEWKKRHGYI